MFHSSLRGRFVALALVVGLLLLPLSWAQASPIGSGAFAGPSDGPGLLSTLWHLLLNFFHHDGGTADNPRQITSVWANGGPCIDPDGHTIDGCVAANGAATGGAAQISTGDPSSPLVN
jgi:hypothetical protein